MPDRILITGGAGFVGSTLGFELRRRYPSASIVAFDNLHRRGSELNLPRLKAAGIRFVHGDVRNAADLDAEPCDLLIECSAEPAVQAGYATPPNYAVETNLFGCYNCLNLARRTKADFVFLSTSRVYPIATLNALPFRETSTRFEWLDGQTAGASKLGISEELSTRGVRSVYGMTKLAAELMIEEFADAYGLRYVVNRCGLIAGPWQMGKVDQGVVTLWLAAHYFDKPLSYLGFGGQGKQLRDVLHSDDLAELVALQTSSMGSFRRQTLNVGGGIECSLSLREMTDACQEVTGNRMAISGETAERPADLRIYVSDTRRIAGLCRWRPQRGPQVVLRDIYQWVHSNREAVMPSLFAAA